MEDKLPIRTPGRDALGMRVTIAYVVALRGPGGSADYTVLDTRLLDVPWMKDDIKRRMVAKMEARYGDRFLGLWDLDAFAGLVDGFPEGEVPMPLYEDPLEEPEPETLTLEAIRNAILDFDDLWPFTDKGRPVVCKKCGVGVWVRAGSHQYCSRCNAPLGDA